MVITDSVPHQRQNRTKGLRRQLRGFRRPQMSAPDTEVIRCQFFGGVRGDGRLMGDGELSRLEVLRGSGSETIHDWSGGAVAGRFGNRLR